LPNKRPDPPDLEEVINSHGPALWRIAGTYARGQASREDLYQEILVALWQALPKFRGDASLRTFIYRVGHNRGATFLSRRLRRERRELPLETQDAERAVAGSQAADASTEAADLSHRLRSAVSTLPESLAQVTTLRLEGMTATEIGAILGLSTNNIEVRLHRARAILREQLDREDFR
jgi:RNA polymerase sigma factor (sigma-70 family)